MDDKTIFGFGNFEHCLDSFFGWLFNNCPHPDDKTNEVAIRLFLLFCGHDQKEKDLPIVKNTCAEPQPSYEGGSYDLFVSGTIENEEHVVFIEDKTKSYITKSQMERHLANYLQYYISKPSKRHLVVVSTNPSQKVKDVDGKYKVVLLKDLVEVFDRTKGDDEKGFQDQLTNQFYSHICYRARRLSIDNLSNDVVGIFANDVFKQANLAVVCNTKKDSHEYPSLKNHSLELLLKTDSFDCGIYFLAENKSKPSVRIYDKTNDASLQSIVQKVFETKKDFRRIPNTEIERLILNDRSIDSKDKLKKFLIEIKQRVLTCLNELKQK